MRISSPERRIAGIGISDSKLIGVFLKPPKTHQEKVVIDRVEQIDLPAGVVEDGKLRDKKGLEDSLRKLIEALFPPTRFLMFTRRRIPDTIPVILSISSHNVYAQLFHFPTRISYERLEESMKLTAGFSLPLPVEEVYLDWELVSSPREKEEKILLALIKKEIVDPYLAVFRNLQFAPIVCEPYFMSLNRLVSLIEEEPFCLVFVNYKGAEISISKAKKVQFVTTFYWKNHPRYIKEKPSAKEDILGDEILRVINFYQTDQKENPKISKIYLLGSVPEIPKYRSYLERELDIKVIIPDIPIEIGKLKGEEEMKTEMERLHNLEIKASEEIKKLEEEFNKKRAMLRTEIEQLKSKSKLESEDLVKLKAEKYTQVKDLKNKLRRLASEIKSQNEKLQRERRNVDSTEAILKRHQKIFEKLNQELKRTNYV